MSTNDGAVGLGRDDFHFPRKPEPAVRVRRVLRVRDMTTTGGRAPDDGQPAKDQAVDADVLPARNSTTAKRPCPQRRPSAIQRPSLTRCDTQHPSMVQRHPDGCLPSDRSVSSNGSVSDAESNTTTSTPVRSPTASRSGSLLESVSPLKSPPTPLRSWTLPPPPLTVDDHNATDDLSISSSQAVAGDVYSSSVSCWSSRTLDRLPQEQWHDSVRSFLSAPPDETIDATDPDSSTATIETPIPLHIAYRMRHEDVSILCQQRDDSLAHVQDLQERLDASEAMVHTLWMALQTAQEHVAHDDDDSCCCETVHVIVSQSQWLVAAWGLAVVLLTRECCAGFAVLVALVWFNLQLDGLNDESSL